MGKNIIYVLYSLGCGVFEAHKDRETAESAAERLADEYPDLEILIDEADLED